MWNIRLRRDEGNVGESGFRVLDGFGLGFCGVIFELGVFGVGS